MQGKLGNIHMNRNDKQCILASCLFPPVPWMAAVFQYDNCFIEMHETYSKQTFRNRFAILTANGRLDLNVPVFKPHGNHTKINEILVPELKKVSAQHLSAIESAYSSSPYFEYFFDVIREFYKGSYHTLTDMNKASVRCIETILRFDLPYAETDVFVLPEKEEEGLTDLRYLITPKNRNFYSFNAPDYYQVFRHKFFFYSNLSILDLVMNMGTETIICLKQYPLQHFIEYLKHTST
jgi:hypothetical protein